MMRFASAAFVGGVHMDVAGRIAGETLAGASNPGTVNAKPGGAGLNAASLAQALGLNCTMTGACGDDAHAVEMAAVLSARGLGDGLARIEGAASGVFLSIVAADGQQVVAVADLGIHERADADFLFSRCKGALEQADCWVLTTNLDKPALGELASRAGEKILVAFTVSQAKAPRLSGIVDRLDLLFGNANEVRALLGAMPSDAVQTSVADCSTGELATALQRLGVKAGVLSDAGGPVQWWDGDAAGTLVPPRVRQIADVNGAGDALAGTVLAGLALGMAMAEIVPLAVAAAQITLESDQPFVEKLTWEMLKLRAAETETITA